jgi:hypothetical protein
MEVAGVGNQMKRRLVLAYFPLALLVVGVMVWVMEDPMVFINRTGLHVGWMPLWAAACAVVGLVLLVLLIAVGDLRHLLQWSTPLFFLLWVLQFAGAAGIYPQASETEHPSVFWWFTRWTGVDVRWWALVLLGLTVLVIAAVSRSKIGRKPAVASQLVVYQEVASESGLLEQKSHRVFS